MSKTRFLLGSLALAMGMLTMLFLDMHNKKQIEDEGLDRSRLQKMIEKIIK